MSRVLPSAIVLLCSAVSLVAGEAERQPVTLSVDFGADAGKVSPRAGFLGGLRDELPDELIQPLNPSLWRIGHQFRGRIKAGLTGAIARVEKLGAKYKLVMSDLIPSGPTMGRDWPDFDWHVYEENVKKLVGQAGLSAASVIWEPVNEPDISHKPLDKYYELYGHAFKALREANSSLEICGPGFAFPSYEKYEAFLKYCRDNKLECNYVAWHFTGWDPHWPEQAKWKLGKMREFIAAYPEQKIKEIHCDEWGAGPDKPGRLHPGRAIVWFHYLENVYRVERACRANWGKEDDYLGGIVTTKGEPYPVYHAYRWYAAAKGQDRAATYGNTRVLACLASKNAEGAQIIVGSICPAEIPVVLELKQLGMKDFKLAVHVLPNANLDKPLAEAEIPACKDVTTEQQGDVLRVKLPKVAENEAYRIVLTKP